MGVLLIILGIALAIGMLYAVGMALLLLIGWIAGRATEEGESGTENPATDPVGSPTRPTDTPPSSGGANPQAGDTSDTPASAAAPLDAHAPDDQVQSLMAQAKAGKVKLGMLEDRCRNALIVANGQEPQLVVRAGNGMFIAFDEGLYYDSWEMFFKFDFKGSITPWSDLTTFKYFPLFRGGHMEIAKRGDQKPRVFEPVRPRDRVEQLVEFAHPRMQPEAHSAS